MNDVLLPPVRALRGASQAPTIEAAVAALADAIRQPEMKAVVVFASTAYDPGALAAALAATFPDTLVIGCTGDGQFGPAGYADRGLVGASIAGEGFWIEAQAIEDFASDRPDSAVATSLALRDAAVAANLTLESCFGLLFVDGTSACEEQLLSAVTQGLGDLPLVGGSAGDDAGLGQTAVFINGRAITDGAVLALCHTRTPFRCFKHQNYTCGAEPMVITDADPRRRIVREINGLPAAEEYARVHGVDPNPADPAGLMLHPCALRVGDQLYLRAVLERLPDGALRFAAAIDVGVILYPAVALPIDASLRDTLNEVATVVGAPALTLGMDCICRRLAMQAADLTDEVGALLEVSRAIGFGSYGEQFNGLQVNMTLTAVAIG